MSGLHDADTASVPTVSAPAVASPGDMAGRINALLAHSPATLFIHIGKAAYRVRQIVPLDDQWYHAWVYESGEREDIKIAVRWTTPLVFYPLSTPQPFTL